MTRTYLKFLGIVLKLSLYAVVLILSTSCAVKPTPIVYNCPKIILPNDPLFPISKLSDTSKPDDTIKAWVATVLAYRDWDRAVRKQVKDSSL